eukprot:gene14972-19826_t
MTAAAVIVTSTVAAYATPPDDTLIVGISADASTFDPAQISSRDNSNIAEHIFVRLYNPDEVGQFTPAAALSYTVSDDGMTYTYKLKPGMTCQDGEVLNADDAAYSFNRAAHPANPQPGVLPVNWLAGSAARVQ